MGRIKNAVDLGQESEEGKGLGLLNCCSILPQNEVGEEALSWASLLSGQAANKA